jgi:hypothetical protein
VILLPKVVDGEEVVILEVDLEDDVILGLLDTPSSTTRVCGKLRWLTHTLQDAYEHVGMPKSLDRVNIHRRRYTKHITLAYSIVESSSCFEEAKCDVVMDNDVWVDNGLQQGQICR